MINGIGTFRCYDERKIDLKLSLIIGLPLDWDGIQALCSVAFYFGVRCKIVKTLIYF